MILKFRQPDCPGTGRKVGTVNRKQPGKVRARWREIVCPECGRMTAVNYDGRIRHHVAKLVTR